MSPTFIRRQVGIYYSVSVENMMRRCRIPAVAHARQMAMYLCRSLLGMSYTAIGRSFKRDHTSAINAVERIEANAAVKADVDAISARVTAGFEAVGPVRVHRCATCLVTITRGSDYCSRRCRDADQAWLDRREVA